MWTNVLRIMVHLHNNHHANYVQMQQAAQMSAGGFAKRYAILRDKGIVKREAWGKYVLTEKGVDMLRQLYAGQFAQRPTEGSSPS